jgi:hypothetical protein
MAKEVVPVNGTNLYEKRPITDDDLQMALNNYIEAGESEVKKWPGEVTQEGYRHNLLEGYAGGRTAAGAFDDLKSNHISTYTKSKYLATGRKNGGVPIATKEGYISYGMEDKDQENVWSSSSHPISTTLPEALGEHFTFLGKEYNCIDVIEIIVIIVLLIIFGMLIYAKLSKDKCVFKNNKYLHYFYDLVN